jgi:D-alanine-D-alanine ligase
MFGGKSSEHEVSLVSAASIINALDKNQYEIVPIAVTKQGRLASRAEIAGMLPESSLRYLNDPAEIQSSAIENKLVPLTTSSSSSSSRRLDVVFPVLHGPFGEDGTVQGWLELADIPYVGCSVLSSAVGMDKDVMKRVFLQAGLPVIDYEMFLSKRWRCEPQEITRRVTEQLGYPCFVKPCNLGSSIGVSKVHSAAELAPAMDLAARYGRKIVVEKGIAARELECSVLGNDEPIASGIGEIVPTREFYDYEAKYYDSSTQLLIPAPLDHAVREQIRHLAIQAFKAIDGAGLARVDFLMDKQTSAVYLNEVNTMPGFTSISMYPKLWEAAGVSFTELVNRLIALALERYEENKVTIE